MNRRGAQTLAMGSAWSAWSSFCPLKSHRSQRFVGETRRSFRQLWTFLDLSGSLGPPWMIHKKDHEEQSTRSSRMLTYGNRIFIPWILFILFRHFTYLAMFGWPSALTSTRCLGRSAGSQWCHLVNRIQWWTSRCPAAKLEGLWLGSGFSP